MLAAEKKEYVREEILGGNINSPDDGGGPGGDEEDANEQEHQGEVGGQRQQEVEHEADVLLPEGEGDAVRTTGH